MQTLVDDFISMNVAGRVLVLCEKYYDENVLMLSNGEVFARSMRESYKKQTWRDGKIVKEEYFSI